VNSISSLGVVLLTSKELLVVVDVVTVAVAVVDVE